MIYTKYNPNFTEEEEHEFNVECHYEMLTCDAGLTNEQIIKGDYFNDEDLRILFTDETINEFKNTINNS